MTLLIGKKAPSFKATAAFSKEFREISLDDYQGKYLVLFFYPLNFTFVCPTELHAFQECLQEFKQLGASVLACSVDSHFSHKAWLDLSPDKGGIKGIEYGLIGDIGGKIARDYGVLDEEKNIACRGLFIMDKDSIVRHQSINDLPLGRNVQEVLRLLEAIQHAEESGEVCPANWAKGKDAIKPTLDSVSQYLKDREEAINAS